MLGEMMQGILGYYFDYFCLAPSFFLAGPFGPYMDIVIIPMDRTTSLGHHELNFMTISIVNTSTQASLEMYLLILITFA